MGGGMGGINPQALLSGGGEFSFLLLSYLRARVRACGSVGRRRRVCSKRDAEAPAVRDMISTFPYCYAHTFFHIR